MRLDHPRGSVWLSTVNPWFIEVISTFPVEKLLHRTIGAMVAMVHLDRPRAQRQREHLVPEADAEDRNRVRSTARISSAPHRRRWPPVAGAVREEQPPPGRAPSSVCRRRRQHGDVAAGAGEAAQDVALGAVVDRHHPPGLLAVRAQPAGQAQRISSQRSSAQARAFPGLVGMDLARDVTCAQSYRWDEMRRAWPAGYPRREGPIWLAGGRDRLWPQTQHPALPRQAGCNVTVLPAPTTAEDILAHGPEGIFLSNGPGDPAATGATPCRSSAI